MSTSPTRVLLDPHADPTGSMSSRVLQQAASSDPPGLRFHSLPAHAASPGHLVVTDGEVTPDSSGGLSPELLRRIQEAVESTQGLVASLQGESPEPV